MTTMDDEHENRLIDAIMLAIGQASLMEEGYDATVAVHLDMVRRALERCIEIVDQLRAEASINLVSVN
jgi:hypothetical protein